MIKISIDTRPFDDMLSLVDGMEQALQDELAQTAEQVGRLLHAEAKHVLQTEVYNVPIPLLASAEREFEERGAIHRARYKNGKRAGEVMRMLSAKALARLQGQTTKGQYGEWWRSGNLKRDESYQVEAEYGRVRIRLFNNADYAKHRNDLGLPGHRRAGEQNPKSRSQTRSVQWQLEAVRKNEARIRELFAGAPERALRRLKRR